MSESPVLVGDILAEKYRVEAILGHGGMGVVVAAWHLDLDKRFAMKFLLPSLARHVEAAERFRREARSAARIQSEHVARVVDVGTMSGGVPFMVMEYLDGRDLAAELQARGSFPQSEAVDYVLQACCAIAEAHARGIVHRDLKPSNLFLTSRPDASKLVKVLDFGISKTMGAHYGGQLSLTRTSALVGSPLYMSPEQLESARDVDLRADVWSLGVILYELLTGKVPFTGESVPQLVRAVLSGQPPAAHESVPSVAPEVSRAVIDCLQLDLSKRFPDIASLAAAVAPFTHDGDRYLRNIRSVLRADSPLSLEANSPPRTEGADPMGRRNTPRGEILASRRTPSDVHDGTSTAIVQPNRLRPPGLPLRGGTELAAGGRASTGQDLSHGAGVSHPSSSNPSASNPSASNSASRDEGVAAVLGRTDRQSSPSFNEIQPETAPRRVPLPSTSSLPPATSPSAGLSGSLEPDAPAAVQPAPLHESSAKSWGGTQRGSQGSAGKTALGAGAALIALGIVFGVRMLSAPEAAPAAASASALPAPVANVPVEQSSVSLGAQQAAVAAQSPSVAENPSAENPSAENPSVANAAQGSDPAASAAATASANVAGLKVTLPDNIIRPESFARPAMAGMGPVVGIQALAPIKPNPVGARPNAVAPSEAAPSAQAHPAVPSAAPAARQQQGTTGLTDFGGRR